MRTISINREWRFGPGLMDFGKRAMGQYEGKIVNLPHDYMIESDVFPQAPSPAASAHHNAAVAHYVKDIELPAA